MIWNAIVNMTVTIDYDDIEADTKEEAKEIAKERAREGIDYNNCDADGSSIYALVWESEEKGKKENGE